MQVGKEAILDRGGERKADLLLGRKLFSDNGQFWKDSTLFHDVNYQPSETT